MRAWNQCCMHERSVADEYICTTQRHREKKRAVSTSMQKRSLHRQDVQARNQNFSIWKFSLRARPYFRRSAPVDCNRCCRSMRYCIRRRLQTVNRKLRLRKYQSTDVIYYFCVSVDCSVFVRLKYGRALKFPLLYNFWTTLRLLCIIKTLLH